MNRIKELREERELRQSDVAAATGIDQRTLSNYETGKTNPDSFAIIKLADFFGVSCDYLLGVNEISVKDKNALKKELNDIKKRIDHISKSI